MKYFEFFAGGGMARAGLGSSWTCLSANDIDSKKAASYAENWGRHELIVSDVSTLAPEDLPGKADLVWASFPCQDLSLAGAGAGLNGSRSGTFWPFWRLIQRLCGDGRAPKLVVLENVRGALTSHGGKDFCALLSAFAKEGYSFGPMVIDAVHFVPQSRPRLFILGVKEGMTVPGWLVRDTPAALWSTSTLIAAKGKLNKEMRSGWIWWNLPAPPQRNTMFGDLVEIPPVGVEWHTKAETRRLIDLMTPLNRQKIQAAKSAKTPAVGTLYKRTRLDGDGKRFQRAEVRFDGIAGCLRTPIGGSSRQYVVVVEGNSVRSRLLSPREAARIMGLPDTYILPDAYNEAYHLAGDGVVVPVVRHIAQNLLEPILHANASQGIEAA